MGILTHVLKISAAEWGTNQIDSRSQDHVLSTSPGLLPQHASHVCRPLPVPGAGDGRITGQVGHVIIRRPLRRPVVVLQFLSDPHGAVRHPERRDSEALHTFRMENPLSMNHPDLLFQGHFPDQIPDLLHCHSFLLLAGLFFSAVFNGSVLTFDRSGRHTAHYVFLPQNKDQQHGRQRQHDIRRHQVPGILEGPEEVIDGKRHGPFSGIV